MAYPVARFWRVVTSSRTASKTEPSVHPQVQARFDQARSAYLNHDYASADEHDADALREARAIDCRAGEVRALRYLGLCAYRLGQAERSVELLDQAQSAANELGWTAEELLVLNHLGASLSPP